MPEPLGDEDVIEGRCPGKTLCDVKAAGRRQDVGFHVPAMAVTMSASLQGVRAAWSTDTVAPPGGITDGETEAVEGWGFGQGCGKQAVTKKGDRVTQWSHQPRQPRDLAAECDFHPHP